MTTTTSSVATLHALFQERFSKFAAWTPNDPPIDWLISHNSASYYAFGIAIAIICALFSLIALFNEALDLAVGHFAMSGLFYMIARVLSSGKLSARVCEVVACTAYCCIACVGQWTPIFASDPIYRHRFMGLNLVATKAGLVLLGLRTLPSVTILVISGINEVVATYVIFHSFGDVVPSRIAFVILFYSALHAAVVYQMQLRLRAIYDTKKQVEAEKEASEALLSMVSDAHFWIAANGSTVLRSDKRLDTLMGTSMHGVQLSEFVLKDERERVETAFNGGTSNKRIPVQLLHTTFVREAHPHLMQVDLFIDDRRFAFNRAALEAGLDSNHSSGRLGFLVGLRLNASDGSHHPALEAAASHSQESRSRRAVRFQDQVLKNAPCDGDSSQVSESIQSIDSGVLLNSVKKQILKTRCSVRNSVKSQFDPPHGSPFVPSKVYLAECSRGILYDLAACWNFGCVSCCRWHGAMERLANMLEELVAMHTCTDGWAPTDIQWQCANCTALIGDDCMKQCWVCGEDSESSLPVGGIDGKDPNPDGIRNRHAKQEQPA